MEKKSKIVTCNNSFCFPVKIEESWVEESVGEDNKKEVKRYIIGLAACPGRDRNIPAYEITEEALKEADKDLDVNNVLFLEHDRSQPIGKVVEHQYIPNKGIKIKAMISNTADRVWQMIKEGILTGLSIGARVLKYVEEESKSSLQEIAGEVARKVLKMELYEISVVALPANVNCRIHAYIEKSLNKGGDNDMSDKEFLLEDEIKEEEKISEHLKTTEKSDSNPEQKTEKIEQKVEQKTEQKVEEILNPDGETDDFDPNKILDIEEAKKDNKVDVKKAVELLKAALRARTVKKLKEAIQKVIEYLSGKGYYYYYYEEDGEKPKEYEYYEKVKKDLDDLNAKIDKVVKEVSNEKIQEMVKTTIKEIVKDMPSAKDLRESMGLINELKAMKEEEETKNLSRDERMLLALNKLLNKTK